VNRPRRHGRSPWDNAGNLKGDANIIALALQFFSCQASSEGSGGGVAILNVTGFVLAVLVAMIGLATLAVGTIRVRRGT
jgi:hypothetical protein